MPTKSETILENSGLKAEHEAAQAAASAAGARCTELSHQKNAELQAIAQLQEKYDAECQRAARGEKNADPGSLLAEMDRRRHQVRGLELLLASAEQEKAPLDQKARVLAEKWTRHQEEASIEILITRQFNATKYVAELEEGLKVARGEMFGITNELSALRGQIERRRRQTAA